MQPHQSYTQPQHSTTIILQTSTERTVAVPIAKAMEEEESKFHKALNALRPSKHTSSSKKQSEPKGSIGSQSLRSQRSLAQLGYSMPHNRNTTNLLPPIPQLGPPLAPLLPNLEPYSPNRYCSLDLQGHNSNGGLADGDGGGDSSGTEPDAALLGSLDYHEFLGASSGPKPQPSRSFTSASPRAATPKHKEGINLDIGKHRTPTTAIRSGTVRGTPVETPTHQQRLCPRSSPPPQDSSLQHLPDLFDWHNTPKSTHSKESSSLKGSFTALDATGKTSAPALVLGGASPLHSNRSTSQPRLPRSLRSSTPSSGRSNAKTQTPRTPRPAMDPASNFPPLNRFLEDSPTPGVEFPWPGPAVYIPDRAVAPVQLQPFIGPLLPQQPPPTTPLPPVPNSRTRQSSMAAMPKDINEATRLSYPRGFSEAMTPVKRNAPSVMSKASTAGRTDDSLESNAGQRSLKKLRTALRHKVSSLFGDEARTPSASHAPIEADHAPAPISTYRPISMTSLDPDGNFLSGIFDDVFNASHDPDGGYRCSAGPAGPPSVTSRRPSSSVLAEEAVVNETAPRVPVPSRITTQTAFRLRKEFAVRLAATLGITDSTAQAAILSTITEVARLPPALTRHPVIRGDLPLQARLGIIEDPANGAGVGEMRGQPVHLGNNVAPLLIRAANLHVPPPNLGRQRPTQVAVSTRAASRSTPLAVEPLTGYTTRSLVTVPDAAKGRDDVDATPTLDRSVDLTWYRFARKSGHNVKESGLPNMAKMFDAHSTVYMVRYSKGRESRSAQYDHLRRFAYYELDGPIRFNIMEKLLEDYLPGKPVLLNHARQASPAWPDDAFASLWELLGPLQNVLMACPRLRADVMTAILMIQPFHVIFSPFVKSITQPLPTKWLFKYLYFMQDVRVELDMTKLGFGHSWSATGLSTRLWDIGNLVDTFVDEMLRRHPHAHPMAQLTIHCRRFFGYRQGDNPHQGDVAFYKALAGMDDEQKPSMQPEGQPWNYGRQPASFPPSAKNPYSGHRRHHAGGPKRVPFLHEGHMSVADPFHKLTGRIWSVRMVGMSEKWTMEFYKFWPKVEFDAIPRENLGLHIDRHTPSRHSYTAPGHAIFLDYGIRAGLHRFPPLPDSEPMVCTSYDSENNVFLEVGSGNILTVADNGIEIIGRSENPPIPRRDLPVRGSSPISLNDLPVTLSRIPGPVGRHASPIMQAMRKGTPKKALQLLGVEGDHDPVSASPTLQGDSEDDPATPTASCVPSAATCAPPSRHASGRVHMDDSSLSESATDHRRSSSTPTSTPGFRQARNRRTLV